MPAPRLTDEEKAEFLSAPHIAKVATHNEDGTIRIVPLWFRPLDDGSLEFSTWPWTRCAQNVVRDPNITVMVDTVDMPYKGVHMVGTARLGPESTEPAVFGAWFGDYTGSEDSGLEYAGQLIEQGGPRVPIIFTPDREYTWDFAKS